MQMAHEKMLPSLRENQTRTAMTYHTTPSRQGSGGERKQVLVRTQKNWNPKTLLKGIKMVQPLWKSLVISQNLNTELSLNSLSSPGEMCSNKNLYIFLETVFIIAKGQKQPRSPSTEEWTRKMWNSHTVGYYSV